MKLRVYGLMIATLMLAGVGSAQAAAAIAALGSQASVIKSNSIASFTVPAGTNRLLVVTASHADNGGVALTSVTYGAQAMTQAVISSDGSTAMDSIWILKLSSSASPTTAAAITVTTNAGASTRPCAFISAQAFQNVDQINPIQPVGAANIGSNSVANVGSTLNVTSSATDMLFDIFDDFNSTAPTSTPGGGQTGVSNSTAYDLQSAPAVATYPGFAIWQTSMKAGSGATGTMSWTSTGSAMLSAAISMKQAVSVAPSLFSAQTPPTKGDIGFAYAGYTYIADGSPAPTYALAPTSGALPTNLSLSSAGVLSGTPTANGTFSNIIVRATNSAGFFDSSASTITIAQALTIAPAALAAANVGTASNQIITVSNGTTPYTTLNVSAFSAGTTGLTAAALTANAGAGTVTLSGTPTAAGTCTFTVNVTDTVGATLSKNYSLTVNPTCDVLVQILSNQTPVPLGANHASQCQVKNQGPSAATAAVLTVTAATGCTISSMIQGGIAGGPIFSAPVIAGNKLTATVTFTSLPVNATANFFIVETVPTNAGASLSEGLVISGQLPTDINSSNDSATAPFTTVTSADLSVVLSGFSPSAIDAGSATVRSYTVTAANAGPSDQTSVVLTLPMAAGCAFSGFSQSSGVTPTSITTPSVGATSGVVTVNFATLSAGLNAVFVFSETVPAGTTPGIVNDSGAQILPTATDPNTGNNTVTAAVANQFTINAALSIAPAALSAATATKSTSQTITISNGTTPYTTLNVSAFSAGTTGLTAASLTANAGAGTVVLSGTPTAAGTCTFTVNVTDTAGATLTKNYSLTVNAALTLGSLTRTTWTVNQAGFTGTIPIGNGTAPFTVSAQSGLPTGLTATVSGTNVTFTGTPFSAGTFNNVNLTVKDTANATVSQTYSITINQPPTIAPAALAGATAGTATNQIITVSNGTTPYTTLNVTAFSAGTTGLTAAALTANAGAGTVTLSGTPTAAGTCTFTVNVTDTAGATGSKNYTLTVNAALSIAPAALAAATATKSTNQIITVSGGTTPYTTLNVSAFSAGTTGLTAAALTANAGAGTVTLSGTPTAAGTCTFTVNVTDTAGATLSKNYTLTVNPALSIAPAALVGTDVGLATNQTMTASGGTTPYTTLNVSAFAAGGTGLTAANLTANAGTGTVALSGTPTAAGTCTFTVNVTDTAGATLSKNYALTVNPVLSIAPAALNAATAGTATNQTITVSNGTPPYTTLNVSAFSAGTTGLTAAALTANAGAGTVVLSGTPTAAGTCTFTVNVTDTAGGTLSKNYTLTVNAALSIAPAALTQATAGTVTNQTITVSNGTTPYTTLNVTAFSAGTTGLTAAALTANAGAGTVVLNGTPTSAGTCTFTVNATDTAGATLSQNYSLTVNAAIALTPTTLPGGTVYVAYNQTVTSTGGTGTVALSLIGSLPTGLNFNTSTGAITGTPSVDRTYNFSIKGSDTVGASTTQNYTVTIAAPTIVVSPNSLPAGTSATAYSQTFSAVNGLAPYTFAVTVGTLPTGLTLNPTTGVLSGTPTQAGSFNLTIQATDSTPAALFPIVTANPSVPGTGPYKGTVAVTLVIGAPTIAINGTLQSPATLGAPYSQTLTASGGVSPYTFSAAPGTLPPGLALSTSGTLSGAPSAAGTFTFTIVATDSTTGTGPFNGSKQFTIVVNSALALTSSATAVVNPYNGLEYTFTAYVSSSVPVTITWDFGDGSPAATGVSVNHTYPGEGTYTATVTVTDGFKTLTQTLTIQINGGAVTVPILFELLRGKLNFNFQTHQDSLTLNGYIPIAPRFNPIGQTFLVGIGTLTRSFTLNAKAQSGDKNNRFTLTGAQAGHIFLNSAKVSLTLKNQDLFTALSSLGFTNADVSTAQSIAFPVTITYAGSTTVDIPKMLYTAKAQQTGTGKLTRK